MKTKTYTQIIKEDYKVDPINRVVVCTLIFEVELSQHPAYEALLYDFHNDKRFKIQAKARCHQDDHFDEIIGKRIARVRAEQKMFRKTCNLFRKFAIMLNKLADECLQTSTNNFIVYSREQKYLNSCKF